jgi:hypothetical protein
MVMLMRIISEIKLLIMFAGVIAYFYFVSFSVYNTQVPFVAAFIGSALIFEFYLRGVSKTFELMGTLIYFSIVIFVVNLALLRFVGPAYYYPRGILLLVEAFIFFDVWVSMISFVDIINLPIRPTWRDRIVVTRALFERGRREVSRLSWYYDTYALPRHMRWAALPIRKISLVLGVFLFLRDIAPAINDAYLNRREQLARVSA